MEVVLEQRAHCNCVSFCLAHDLTSASNCNRAPAPPAYLGPGPTPRVVHSRKESRRAKRGKQRTCVPEVPEATSYARNGARRPASPGGRDNWFRSNVGGPPQLAHVADSGADFDNKDRPTQIARHGLTSVRLLWYVTRLLVSISGL